MSYQSCIVVCCHRHRFHCSVAVPWLYVVLPWQSSGSGARRKWQKSAGCLELLWKYRGRAEKPGQGYSTSTDRWSQVHPLSGTWWLVPSVTLEIHRWHLDIVISSAVLATSCASIGCHNRSSRDCVLSEPPSSWEDGPGDHWGWSLVCSCQDGSPLWKREMRLEGTECQGYYSCNPQCLKYSGMKKDIPRPRET